MIAQFDSPCRGCNKTIKAGENIYYAPLDGPWHWLCWETQPPKPETVRLAESLGFVEHSEAFFERWSNKRFNQPR